jgi:hypothetical protein
MRTIEPIESCNACRKRVYVDDIMSNHVTVEDHVLCEDCAETPEIRWHDPLPTGFLCRKCLVVQVKDGDELCAECTQTEAEFAAEFRRAI